MPGAASDSLTSSPVASQAGRRRWIAWGGLVIMIAAAMSIYFQYRHATNLRTVLDEMRLNPLSLSAEGLLLGGQKRITPVVLVGDSRAEMWAEFPQVAGVSRNVGVSGHTTGQVLARYALEAKPTKPKVIVIVAGVNDLAVPARSAEQRRQIEQDAERNLGRLIALAREDGTHVILTTVFGIGDLPWRRRLELPGDFETNRLRLNAFIRGQAGEGVIVVDADAVLRRGDTIDGELLADPFHLNPAGYARLNREIEPLLRTLRAQPIAEP